MLTAGGVALNHIALNRDLGDLTLFDLIEKIREDYFGGALLRVAEEIKQQQKNQRYNQPQGDIA